MPYCSSCELYIRVGGALREARRMTARCAGLGCARRNVRGVEDLYKWEGHACQTTGKGIPRPLGWSSLRAVRRRLSTYAGDGAERSDHRERQALGPAA